MKCEPVKEPLMCCLISDYKRSESENNSPQVETTALPLAQALQAIKTISYVCALLFCTENLLLKIMYILLLRQGNVVDAKFEEVMSCFDTALQVSLRRVNLENV